jgi:hypothetical protein
MSAFPKDSPFYLERMSSEDEPIVEVDVRHPRAGSREEDMTSELKDLNDWIIAEAPFGEYVDGDVLDSFVDELQARVSRLIP